MRTWEITAGSDARWLYVELNGEYQGTWDEYTIRAINAEADDDLALFTSPGYDPDNRPAKGDPIASGKVSDLAKPYVPPK